ncbi:MAG: hypothetical protein DMG45_02560 [Acidobacteria bacterium]|nr:MAG: hypothetical protein DMG47_21685 [Acidobacteriota bacterium]PYT45124.1 MAG: hypothetical protein DMG45_02560 [Acidobacteriota bacterium]
MRLTRLDLGSGRGNCQNCQPATGETRSKSFLLPVTLAANARLLGRSTFIVGTAKFMLKISAERMDRTEKGTDAFEDRQILLPDA